MPLAGHDAGGLLSAPIVEGNFNPRAPCGARLGTWGRTIRWRDFNPRAPCGARHKQAITFFFTVSDFNPRAPCGARHNRHSRLLRVNQIFQSTCPLRGTTCNDLKPRRRDGISIHVPLAGHDGRRAAQSLHDGMISIHVPLAGHDRAGFGRARCARHFNPRAPCGARRDA